jgi:hypothetical protein
MRRRSLLTALGGATTLNAGCLSAIEEWSTPATRLGWFGATNADTQSSHRFELAVERDGERVHYSAYELQPAEQTEPNRTRITQAVAECEWGSTKGDYTVRARVDGGDWVEKSVTEYAASNDVECAIASAEYDSSFDLRLRWPCQGREYYDGLCPFVTQ